MTQSLSALLAELPTDKTAAAALLAKENPRFVKLTNTWWALGREIDRFQDDRSRAQDVESLSKMRRIVRGKIDLFLGS